MYTSTEILGRETDFVTHEATTRLSVAKSGEQKSDELLGTCDGKINDFVSNDISDKIPNYDKSSDQEKKTEEENVLGIKHISIINQLSPTQSVENKHKSFTSRSADPRRNKSVSQTGDDTFKPEESV
jgi:hypothetical protein